MQNDAVPEIIRAAGEEAVAAYRQFFDDAKWSRVTRERAMPLMRGGFFHWAGVRGLPLQAIEAPSGWFIAEGEDREEPKRQRSMAS